MMRRSLGRMDSRRARRTRACQRSRTPQTDDEVVAIVMSRTESMLRQIALSFYRAAEHPHLWVDSLENVRALFGGSGVLIVQQDGRGRTGALTAYAGFADEAMSDYAARYHKLDPWNLALSDEDWGPERVIDGRALVPAESMRRTEYFDHMGRRYDCAQAVFTLLEPPVAGAAALSINRAWKQAPFGSRHLKWLRFLSPHVRQALRLHRRLTAIPTAYADAADVLETFTLGIVAVARSGAIVFANQAAREISEQRDGLSIRTNGMFAGSAAAQQRIGRALASAMALVDGNVTRASEQSLTVVVERPSGRRPYVLLISPRSNRSLSGGDAFAVVFISDPIRLATDMAAMLAQVFSLTGRESQVASLLVRGASVEDIGRTLHVTRQTARWYVKQVLQKAECRTQAQFVATWARMLGVFPVNVRA